MQSELTAHLLACATAFGAARGYELSTLGRLAAGEDSKFFTRLRNGEGTFTVQKYDQVMRWFSANWPAGVPWPEGAPRPEATAPEGA